ncbi:MAG TPA: alpha/beta fold hydrolase [Burkholderiales bacterium]|nr:alpha/beta fold hydrolase [Burkholderiales bacterium]
MAPWLPAPCSRSASPRSSAVMRTLFDFAPERCARLLVLLPAAKARPEDFVERGFIDAVRARHLRLDVAMPDLHADLYLEGDIAERLETDVMRSMRAKGYAHIWLAGISLGGMAAVAYACRYASHIAGVILVAPFLGLRDANGEPELLGELAESALPEIFLGYGTHDRFAGTSRSLARRLPAERVTTLEGGHDWLTWIELWKIMLAQAFTR